MIYILNDIPLRDVFNMQYSLIYLDLITFSYNHRFGRINVAVERNILFL